jgi:hypothetical protein
MLSIMQKRGFGLKEYPTSFGFVLVKAEIEEISVNLANLVNGFLVRDVYRNADQVDSNWLLVWQYTNHSWTTFQYPVCKEDIPRRLSKILNTSCIYFQYEDVSGWQGYNLWKDGKIVESYSFGLDYREEMAEALEELEDEMPEELDHGMPWGINTTSDSRDHQFLFRSDLRSVSESDVKNSDSFLDSFFISQDAWLPSLSDIPWVSERQHPEMPESNFVRVDFIKTV